MKKKISYNNINVIGDNATIIINDWIRNSYRDYLFTTSQTEEGSVYIDGINIYVDLPDNLFLDTNTDYYRLSLFRFFKTDKVVLKNLNVYIKQSNNQIDIYYHSGYSNHILLDNCNFTNLSTGYNSGTFWLDADDNHSCDDVKLTNCYLQSGHRDEVVAIYGCGNINCNVYDTTIVKTPLVSSDNVLSNYVTASAVSNDAYISTNYYNCKIKVIDKNSLQQVILSTYQANTENSFAITKFYNCEITGKITSVFAASTIDSTKNYQYSTIDDFYNHCRVEVINCLVDVNNILANDANPVNMVFRNSRLVIPSTLVAVNYNKSLTVRPYKFYAYNCTFDTTTQRLVAQIKQKKNYIALVDCEIPSYSTSITNYFRIIDLPDKTYTLQNAGDYALKVVDCTANQKSFTDIIYSDENN